MKIFTAFAIVQALLIVADAKSIPPDNSKQVTCVYLCPLTESNGTAAIEDFDVSLCDYLSVDEQCMTKIIDTLHSISFLKRVQPTILLPSPGILQKFQKLKEANPDLKLIGQISYSAFTWMYVIRNYPSRIAECNAAEYAVELLNEMGFDGFDFIINLEILDQITTSICEMKTEFEKQGYMITTTWAGRTTVPPAVRATFNYSKLATCCDQMNILNSDIDVDESQRHSSLSMMKSTIDKYIDRGIPPNKMVVHVSAFGITYRLPNPQDTELGKKIDIKRFAENVKNAEWGIMFYRDILKNTKNASYEWTVIRDEETKEPYVFTKTGLWATFEDRASMEVKAKYVQEKGLKGIGIFTINMDDAEGVEGEGRFLLTRTAHDTLKGVLKTVDKTS